MKRLATAVVVVTVGALAFSLVWLPTRGSNAPDPGDIVFDVLLMLSTIAFAVVGRVIAMRAHNRIALVFSAAAMGATLLIVGDLVWKTVIVPHPVWLFAWLGVLSIVGQMLTVASLTILLPLFPTGSLAGKRWRWLTWLWVFGMTAVSCASLLRAGPWDLDTRLPGVTNPLGIPEIGPTLDMLAQVGGLSLLLVVIGGIASLVVRARRGDAEMRAQVRWLALVGGVAVACFLTAGLAQNTILVGNLAWLGFTIALAAGVPAAVAIAILKYRLYDIDVVIRKTVVVGLLAVFITVVYAVIVAVVSGLFEGSQAGSFLAAAALAVLFAPARDRVRKIADRLVYGKRATPYEVLADFSERVGGVYAADDVLMRMAQVLEEGTGASGARVLLQVGSERRQAAAIGERTGDETVVAVSHHGQELGALAVTMPPSDPMNPAKRQLVDDLAAQAGLVLRNVKLIEELKASRQRLVAAQDEERRKLERDIHDGVQQQLVALAVKLKLADTMVDRDPAKAHDALADLQADAGTALEDLRDLARGIYPPLLADRGLSAALEAQARKAAVPTSVTAHDIGRYGQEIESAVYFCSLEALNNIAKYAGASVAAIELGQRDGYLSFIVTDDGTGFDVNGTSYGTGLQGMADRLDAIGATLRVESEPGRGTTVSGSVPVDAVNTDRR